MVLYTRLITHGIGNWNKFFFNVNILMHFKSNNSLIFNEICVIGTSTVLTLSLIHD